MGFLTLHFPLQNKRVLMEYIHKRKAEATRSKQMTDQADARREKVKALRTRRQDRLKKKRDDLIAAQSQGGSTKVDK